MKVKEEKFDFEYCPEDHDATSLSSGSDQTELSPPPNDIDADSAESGESGQNGTQQKKRKRRRKRMLTGVSRQRRAANERERRRIQGVNRAFVELKNSLPVSHMDISKIDILRVAAQWIDHLSELLHQDDQAKSEAGDFTRLSSRLYEDHDLYRLLENGALTSEDDDLLDDFLQIDECIDSSITSGIADRFTTADSWTTWQQPSGGSSGLCIHTEEPYLQSLLYDNAITANYLSSPLVDLADHL
ncbi:protein lin-32 [Nematostella vectensis]|uniref:protein lin-32 n=1 Tax=Nematostella vectensis TaxID=45351 RepID=UPI00138FE938|nr:protein lin-32 [Nematostella vectensis]XP_032229900.1 protein lin-32 [Nematostella vectensis]XP_032229901.1 protein lin-32 [Nematostella vectensis]